MDLPRYHTCASPPTCRIYVHPFRNSFGLIDLCRLSQDTRLTSDSCSSGWCFAIGFLHRGRCLPRLAELLVLPLFGRTADFHRIDTRALLGAQTKKVRKSCSGPFLFLFFVSPCVPSFMAHSFNRIKLGGASRGEKAEYYARQSRNSEG